MRKLLLPLLALCAVLAIGAPVASAKVAHASSTAHVAEGTTLSSASMSTRVRKMQASLQGVRTAIAFFTAQNKARKSAIDAILAGVPAITTGLTQLKDGLTAAGAGLTSLKTLVTSTEYGIAQVYIGGTAAGGAFLATPDIPDSVQPATVMGSFIATGTGAITVKVGVRSAESDGTGASDPAASCRVTVVQGGTFLTSIPNVAKFNAGAQSPPFWDIPTKSPQTSTTDTSFPFHPIATDNLVDLVTPSNSAGSVPNSSGGPYSVTLTCLDLTASSTDPSA